MSCLSKLIVLCDDMWCGRKTETETNIYMLARLMGIPVECGEDSRDDDDFQVRYFDGPGLGNAALDLTFTGSSRPDIATRCIDIYKYIVDHFTDKHEIWMFGLGRGAYVLRCVAGMINKCGIIKKTHDDHETAVLIKHVYSMYETLDHDCRPYSSRMVRFRSRSSWEVATPVRFMGILDTTDPVGLPYSLSLAISKHPPVYDINASSAVKSVYHAISIHERLPLFALCRISEDTAEKEAEVSPSIHEMWFPGMHYDLGRHKFPSTLGAGITGLFLHWLPWPPIHPNLVISDLVLIWMLESIRAEDSSGTLIPDIGRQIEVLGRKLTQGQQSKGSGDIYSRMQPLRYITSWAWFVRLLYPTLRERKILDFNATAYDYRRPLDQSGATIWSLAEISEERYPSATYDEFQLYRRGTGEIDQATYECLLGRECIEQKASLMPGGPVPLTISWQGPNFRDVYGSNWTDVLTITKVRLDGEYYVARTIPEFLSEFYGDLGVRLLDWVAKLCVLKTRMSNTASESQSSVSGILDQVHLHHEADSITAYFADTSLRSTLPTSGATKVRLLSALSWVVAVLQTPTLGAEGLFKVSCKVEDVEIEGAGKWSSQCEQFRPGKKESSCWTQLFDYACIAEVPRDFQLEPSDRPEGLEIDFDLLVDLSRASRAMFTEYGVVLLGFDTALIQLRPVDSRRWHVVRTPGSLITPLEILKAIEFTGQSSTKERETELNSIHDAIQSSFNLSAEAKEPESVQPRGAIKSSLRLDKRAKRTESRVFEYPPGKVYVGWCDRPTVRIGAEVPDKNFLEKFDSQTTVPEVTGNIFALEGVNTVTNATIGARLGFLGNVISGDLTYGRTRARRVQQTTVEYRFNLFTMRLRAPEKTPIILWDDSTQRAWLLPGVSVLFFVSICLFELLELVFEGPMRYVTPSDNTGTKASECLQGNWRLRLIDIEAEEPTDITFGDLVLDLWEGMKAAQSVCYASTDNSKHRRDGVVFGYGLYDLLSIGSIPLRYLDETRAGANLRSWEPLARHRSLQVIFCKHVGPVIECAANTCAGIPCGQFCQSLDGTNGVLSCLLPDFKSFFGNDWGGYSESGILPVIPGFEWIPTSPDIFTHCGRRLPPGGVCECCFQLKRLQSVVRHTTPSTIKRWFRRMLWDRTPSTPFLSSAWLEQAYAVRFGAVSLLRRC
ncbi:Uncharacterized protein HZ326_26400 [Fusarium oxysporum f. sp. albedinis]|nr:Uncharacterized protein HZ326_26400 [Fusarium oxysporum f. sp. albedinis]